MSEVLRVEVHLVDASPVRPGDEWEPLEGDRANGVGGGAFSRGTSASLEDGPAVARAPGRLPTGAKVGRGFRPGRVVTRSPDGRTRLEWACRGPVLQHLRHIREWAVRAIEVRASPDAPDEARARLIRRIRRSAHFDRPHGPLAYVSQVLQHRPAARPLQARASVRRPRDDSPRPETPAHLRAGGQAAGRARDRGAVLQRRAGPAGKGTSADAVRAVALERFPLVPGAHGRRVHEMNLDPQDLGHGASLSWGKPALAPGRAPCAATRSLIPTKTHRASFCCCRQKNFASATWRCT